MKHVLVGIIAAIILAVALHAAYSGLTATKNQQPSAAQVAQPVAVVIEEEEVTIEEPVAQNDNFAAPVVVRETDTIVARTQTAKNQPVNVVAVEAVETATVQPVAAKETVKEQKPVQEVRPAANRAVANRAVNNAAATQDNTLSNPDSVAEYDFAFVDPQAVMLDPMASISGATEQAVQDVLSPSAPRN